ncbi:hypothetical protein QVD17_00658 [Tagetes erecta]|uniref:Uncharacterized protein n=1 Tax=Tagetes erecta TaxID=13708 RepID=A0AAD8L668_TARER|nr:hypothetical protein QVD17_00658 [Tagetes erecta]
MMKNTLVEDRSDPQDEKYRGDDIRLIKTRSKDHYYSRLKGRVDQWSSVANVGPNCNMEPLRKKTLFEFSHFMSFKRPLKGLNNHQIPKRVALGVYTWASS